MRVTKVETDLMYYVLDLREEQILFKTYLAFEGLIEHADNAIRNFIVDRTFDGKKIALDESMRPSVRKLAHELDLLIGDKDVLNVFNRRHLFFVITRADTKNAPIRTSYSVRDIVNMLSEEDRDKIRYIWEPAIEDVTSTYAYLYSKNSVVSPGPKQENALMSALLMAMEQNGIPLPDPIAAIRN